MLSVTAELIADINFGSQDSFPNFFTDFNGAAFFEANDGTHGRELWKTDGTPNGTVLVKDITPGVGGSEPSTPTIFNEMLFFTAAGTHGRELWTSDGTTAGTVLLKDIRPNSIADNSASPAGMTEVNGTLFFSAHDGINGRELWKTDGTTAGTVLVKDIFQGTMTEYYQQYPEGRPNSSYPGGFTNVNGTLFFSAADGANGTELWKSDGTTAGTVVVKDINPGIAPGAVGFPVNANGTLFFFANDGIHGVELWKSDGTAAGTVLVKDINVGSANSSARFQTDVNGTLFFVATDTIAGWELWKSDGTAAGTVLVKDIFPGIGTFQDSPQHLTNVNGTLYFTADDGVNGRELWKSDGTATGTVRVKDIFSGSGSSNPQSTAGSGTGSPLTHIGGTLFFAANDGLSGVELWKSDGTDSGTVLVQDIFSGSGSASPNRLNNVNGTLFFTAHDGTNGLEPWRLVAAPIEVPVNTATINDDLQAAVSDSLSASTGSGAVPSELQLSATDAQLDAVIAAVEALAPSTDTPVVTIVVTLADGDYDGQTITVPAGVRLVIDGTTSSVTFEGASPAFTVISGDVVIRGVTFVNSTDAPTILVTGGSLVVRDSTVVETTGGSRPAIEVLGGSVDLGTAADLGGNVLNVSGAGELIRNTSGSAISAIGNTFQADGVPFASNFRVEDKIYHGLDASGIGVVTFVAGNAFVTPASGSIQRGVDGVAAEGTVQVEGTFYADYSAGAKPLTVQFTTGQRFSQESDSLATGVRSLFVTGTAAAEDIEIEPGPNPGQLDVAMSGVPTGTFAPQGRIVISGGAGNDDIQIAGSIALPAWLYGGAGNDRLKGGAGHDLLFGEDGDDLLVGGSGRDLLIGGTGADRIVGNAEDDILIAGFTNFDGNPVALSAIMAEWTSVRDYATRTANISGTGSGPRLNDNHFLTTQGTGRTVHDDAVKDTMTGSEGQDWFFANLENGVLDKVTDLHAEEFQPDLDFILSE